MPKIANRNTRTQGTEKCRKPQSDGKLWAHDGNLEALEGRFDEYSKLQESAEEHAPFLVWLIDVKRVCAACKMDDVTEVQAALWLYALNNAYQTSLIMTKNGRKTRIDDCLDFDHPDGAQQREFTKSVLMLPETERRHCVAPKFWWPCLTGAFDRSGDILVEAGYAERGVAQSVSVGSWEGLKALSPIQRLELGIRNSVSGCRVPEQEAGADLGCTGCSFQPWGGGNELFVPCWGFRCAVPFPPQKRRPKRRPRCDRENRPWLPTLFIGQDQAALQQRLQEWHDAICRKAAWDAHPKVQPLLAEYWRKNCPSASEMNPVDAWLLNPSKATQYPAQLFLRPIMQAEAAKGFAAKDCNGKTNPERADGCSTSAGEDVPDDTGCVEFPKNPNVYRPASKFLTTHVGALLNLNYKRFAAMVMDYSKYRIRRTRPRSKAGVEIKNRLNVHIGDVCDCFHRMAAVDGEGFPNFPKHERDRIREAIRRSKIGDYAA